MNASSHRRASGIVAVLLAVVAVCTPVLAQAGLGSREAPMTSVAARPAGALVDSVGLGVHLGFLDTPYARTDVVVDALQDLGVEHVRDEFRLDQPRQWEALRTLGRAGIHSDLIVGPRPDQAARFSQEDPATHVATLARELAGTVDAVEGLNEWDLWGGPTWARDVRAWQEGLYAAVRDTPALDGVPVLAPSITWPRNWHRAGDLAAVSDRDNAHLYPDARQPGGLLQRKRAEFVAAHGTQPLMITETGYHNATGPATALTQGHPPVSERAAATYLPRLVAGDLAAGVERTYLYELIDQFADPTRSMREHHFGLLRHDLSPKPAYVALRDLLRLASGGTATGTAGPGGGPGVDAGADALSFAVDDAPDDLQRLVLQRPDGSHLLLLWRDVSVWDVEARRDVPVDAASITVRLAERASWSLQRPGTDGRVDASGEGTRVPVRLGARLTALVLDAPA